MTDERFKKAEFSVWISIFGSVFLTVMKGVAGYISGSKALIADALHSASDVAGAFAALVGLRAAKLPSDETHPNGHGKTESVAAIIISVLLLLIGIETGIASVKAIFNGVDSPPGVIALIVIFVSILVKEAIFQYQYRLGKQISIQAMITNAWEHRSGVYSSITAFVGGGGALLGHYLGNKYLYYLDPIAGLCIAVLILRMGYRLVMKTVHKTTDHVLGNADAAELSRTVQTVKGVIAVDDLRAREHGHYVIVDVKISVNPRISVLEGHEVAKTVKHTLMKRFIHVSDVFIHVNPYDPGYPYKNNVDPEQDDFPSLVH
ncbi:MAG: cation diffusion facilitator transporter [Paenibacillus sp.]|nr:cation diffusion facilitator transporter [Paenibacillus sp.]